MISYCLCMFRSLPETFQDTLPEEGPIGEPFDVFEKEIIGEQSGVILKCRYFGPSKLPECQQDSLENNRHERIKKLHSGSCRLGDDSFEMNNEENISSMFDDENSFFKREMNELSAEETSVSRINNIRNKVFLDISDSILKSVKKSQYVEFAVDPNSSTDGKSIIFNIKRNIVEVIEREIRQDKVIKNCVFSIYNAINDTGILTSTEPALIKAKKLIEGILQKAIKLGLASEEEAKHYAFVIDEENDWSRTNLNDIFLYPYSLKMKTLIQTTMSEMNIKYESLLFANSNYYRIIKATQNNSNSNNYVGRVTNIDESAFKSVISHKRPENYLNYEYLKSGTHQVLYDTPSYTNTDLKKEENIGEEPEYTVNLYFDTRNDKFDLFVVYLKNGRGKIFHLNLNKKSIKDLLKYKVELIEGEKNTTELSFSFLGDYIISAISHNEIKSLEECKKDFDYNLLFTSKNKYLKVIKRLLLDYKQKKNNFLDLFDYQLPESVLLTFKEQRDNEEDITLDDIFLCEKIRSLHVSDFINTEQFVNLRDMILEELEKDESTKVTKNVSLYNESNLLDLRNFMIGEIVNIMSKIVNSEYPTVKTFSEFDLRNAQPIQDESDWELNSKLTVIRKRFWDIFLHQEENNDLEEAVLYFE